LDVVKINNLIKS